ncbi:MAG: hypothetical protein DRI65_17675, partial [Chloroflexota bacterium]
MASFLDEFQQGLLAMSGGGQQQQAAPQQAQAPASAANPDREFGWTDVGVGLLNAALPGTSAAYYGGQRENRQARAEAYEAKQQAEAQAARRQKLSGMAGQLYGRQQYSSGQMGPRPENAGAGLLGLDDLTPRQRANLEQNRDMMASGVGSLQDQALANMQQRQKSDQGAVGKQQAQEQQAGLQRGNQQANNQQQFGYSKQLKQMDIDARERAAAQAAKAQEFTRNNPVMSTKDRAGMSNTLRDDFGKDTGAFTKMANSWTRMKNAKATGAGDLAMVFSYMKMLDPESTVMASEQATAQNSGGVPES